MSLLWFSLLFLGIGFLTGFLAQRSRMCFVAGLRNWILVRETELLAGLFAFLATVWVLTSALSALGLLHQGVPEFAAGDPGGEAMPAGESRAAVVAAAFLVHPGAALLPRLSSLIGNFFFATLAGGFLIGVISVIAGGCVLRQHVLCAQGERNSLFYLVGFYGATIVYYTVLGKVFAWVYQ
jgi:hypothetical protein